MSSSTRPAIPSLVQVRERLGGNRFRIEQRVGARLLVLRELRAVIGFNPVVNPKALTAGEAHLYDTNHAVTLAQMHRVDDNGGQIGLPASYRGVVFHFHKYDSDLACIQDMGLNIFRRPNLPCLGFLDVDRVLVDLQETANEGEITEARTNGGLFESLGHQTYMRYHGFFPKAQVWQAGSTTHTMTLGQLWRMQCLWPSTHNTLKAPSVSYTITTHYEPMNGFFGNQEERNLLETIDVDKEIPKYLQSRTLRVAFDLEFDDANKKTTRPAEKVVSLAMVFLDIEDVVGLLLGAGEVTVGQTTCLTYTAGIGKFADSRKQARRKPSSPVPERSW